MRKKTIQNVQPLTTFHMIIKVKVVIIMLYKYSKYSKENIYSHHAIFKKLYT